MADLLSFTASIAGIVTDGDVAFIRITKYLDGILDHKDDIASVRTQVKRTQDLLNVMARVAKVVEKAEPNHDTFLAFMKDFVSAYWELDALNKFARTLYTTKLPLPSHEVLESAHVQEQGLAYPFHRPTMDQLQSRLIRVNDGLQAALQTSGWDFALDIVRDSVVTLSGTSAQGLIKVLEDIATTDTASVSALNEDHADKHSRLLQELSLTRDDLSGFSDAVEGVDMDLAKAQEDIATTSTTSVSLLRPDYAETQAMIIQELDNDGSSSVTPPLDFGSTSDSRPFSLNSTMPTSVSPTVNSEGTEQPYTLSAQLAHELRQDDETRTHYTTRRTLPRRKIDLFTSEFAEVIYTNVCGRYSQETGKHLNMSWVEKLHMILPEVLRSFAIQLGHDALANDSGKKHDIFEAMRFIHLNRRKIATGFKHKFFLDAQDEEDDDDTDDQVKETDIPTKDITSWLNSVDESAHIGEDDVTYGGENDARGDWSQQSTYQDLEHYSLLICQTPAFKWLTNCLSRELYLCSAFPDTMDGIRQSIVDSLLPPRSFSATQAASDFRVRFQIDWDPATFIRLQNYGENENVALENAITLTESAVGPQATLCREYLSKVWPSTGVLTLKAVQRSLHVEHGTSTNESNCHNCIQRVWSDSSKLNVDTCGSASAVAEVAEQMAWLGAAFYCHPTSDESNSGLRYCRPLVDRADEDGSTTIDQTWNIRFEVRSKSSNHADSPNSQCWIGLFYSPIVVEGYPTLSRPEGAHGTGLEIPLHIAAQLLRARHVTTFEGRVFLKGFCAMLVLSKALEDSQTFMWHLVSSRDGGYISYLDSRINKRPPCEIGSEQTLLTQLVHYGRHVIGWCQEAHSLAGMDAPDHMLKVQASKLAMVKNRKGRSYRSQDVRRLPDEMAALGLRDTGVALRRSQAATYYEKLDQAKKWWFVFYDTSDVRAWFVDGASALLHLLRSSLATYQDNRESANRYIFQFKDLVPFEGNRSYWFLENDANRTQKLRSDFSESFQDKVEVIWSKLDWVVAEQEILNGENRKLLGQVQGFQFVDIAGDDHSIRVCAAELEPSKSTWLNLIRIPRSNTAVLFGHGFGDLIQPSGSALDNLCQYWKALPKGEGYLAARVCDIEENLRHKRYYSHNTWQIGDDQSLCHWFAPNYLLSHKSCNGAGDSLCCEKAHVILPDEVAMMRKGGTYTCPQETMPRDGAIIFGISSQCPRYWEKDRSGESLAAEEISPTGSATSRMSNSPSFGATAASSLLDTESNSRLSRHLSVRSRRCDDNDNDATTSPQLRAVSPIQNQVGSKAGSVMREKTLEGDVASVSESHGELRRSTSQEGQMRTIQPLLDILTSIKNGLSTFLPFCAHLPTALVCMFGFFAPLKPGDSLCARVRWLSCCILSLYHFFLSSRGWVFRSRLLSVASSAAFLLLLAWCIIMTPVQILFTTPLEQWKRPPDYTFVPHHIKYQPPPSGGIDADVFAIHGLGSNPSTAWKSRNNGTEWLRDILPKQPGFENIRVITLNHQSQWNSNRDIQSLAESMLGEIISINEGQRRIFFIAHSFGGLFLKEVLSIATKRAERSEPVYGEAMKANRVIQQTRGIFFLGTPHYGTSDFWAALSCLLTCTGQSLGSSTMLLQYMWRNNLDLQALDASFRGYIRSHRPYVGNFIEQRPEMVGPGKRWALWKVVDESQAELDYRFDRIDWVKNDFLDTDHVGLNKFQSADDPNFQVFFRQFREALRPW